MGVILCVFFLILNFSFATENISSYKILEKTIKFYSYPDMRLTISEKCEKAKLGNLCENLLFLNKITTKDIMSKSFNGQNPSSALCKHSLKGKVYIGIDDNRNENSFCLLKDGLYIDGGTLIYYAEKNDGITQSPRKLKKVK